MPTNERWVGAFELAAAAALLQLVIVLPQRRPTNRLILGANLYLLAGRASLWLLGATATAVLVALAFQGDRTWAAMVPVIALAVLQRTLRSRLRSSSAGRGMVRAAAVVSWPP